MLKKEIIFLGQKATVACDGKCEKAWGLNNRPRIQLDDHDFDDFAFLSDDELGIAPIDPGTYEGGVAKPTDDSEKMNKWCVRECERRSMSKPGEHDKPIKLKDFSQRLFNIKRISNE